jgi:hypothetical protein
MNIRVGNDRTFTPYEPPEQDRAQKLKDFEPPSRQGRQGFAQTLLAYSPGDLRILAGQSAFSENWNSIYQDAKHARMIPKNRLAS